MSLDVWLHLEGVAVNHDGSGIFVREGGATKEISREEWDEKFPGREPVVAPEPAESSAVFTCNITHNLAQMAEAAGLYKAMWRPEEVGITHAHQLIKVLEEGLLVLLFEPDKYKEFNPKNGWGDYGGLVEFVRSYWVACSKFPGAEVRVSR